MVLGTSVCLVMKLMPRKNEIWETKIILLTVSVKARTKVLVPCAAAPLRRLAARVARSRYHQGYKLLYPVLPRDMIKPSPVKKSNPQPLQLMT